MPAKRGQPSTPPSTKKKAKKVRAQPSIDSFFSSPTKPRLNGTTNRERRKSVISFVDSDDEPDENGRSNGDEELARKLVQEWADGAEDGKGKSKAPSPVPDVDGDDVQAIEAPCSEPNGVNGSSSSAHLLPPVKLEWRPSPDKDDKPAASIFAKQRTPSPPDMKPEHKSPATASKSSATTLSSAEPVEAIDFDVDAFLFRPSQIDVSRWPKGRSPYSVLVGVYVQVSSTRSRITIVRVLTKCVYFFRSSHS